MVTSNNTFIKPRLTVMFVENSEVVYSSNYSSDNHDLWDRPSNIKWAVFTFLFNDSIAISSPLAVFLMSSQWLTVILVPKKSLKYQIRA